jgi:hypothetical protein
VQLHPDFEADIDRVLRPLVDHYRVPCRVEVYTKPGDRSMASAGKGCIRLNSYWFSEPRAKIIVAGLRGRRHGARGIALWHGLPEPDHVFTHEYGHLVAEAIGRPAERFMDDRFQEISDYPELSPSGYGIVNAAELWAETFATAHVGDRRHPEAQRLLTFLDKVL